MIELMLKEFSLHAVFSIYFTIVFGIVATITAYVLGYNMENAGAVAFVFGSIIYLVIDFYETFGDDNEY